MATKTLTKDFGQQALNVFNNAISRIALSAYFGKTHGGVRDLYESFGYPRQIQPAEFMAMYLRNGMANRIVRSFPGSTWRQAPIIHDEEGESEDEEGSSFSPFTKAVNDLFEKHRVIHHLERADRLSGIGKFGVLVMGFQDGEPMYKPLTAKKAPLLFMQAYSELNTVINTYEMDEQNPRFGLPKQYTVKAGMLNGDKSSQTRSIPVHHSRVLHLSEFLDEDNVFGTPRLMPAFNHLMDLEKVLGSGAETFWLNARPGLGIFADKESNFDAEALKDMKAQAEDYDNQLKRVLALQGVTAQQFQAAIADPKPNIETLLDVISGTVGIPKRILIGSERGELSSTQDETNWSSKIEERRENFATPSILKPFIGLMIKTGNLPDPKEKFTVAWPDEGALGPEAEANMGMTRSNTLRNYVTSPGAELIVPPSEFRTKFLGLEAESEYADEVDPYAEQPLDEENPEVVDEFDDSAPVEQPATIAPSAPVAKKNAKPRSLYVRRDVLNAKEIVDWAKRQGFKTTVPASDMHVTLVYCKSHIDWMKLPEAFGMADGKLEIAPGGVRLIETLGKNAVALLFVSSTLKWRHDELHRDTGLKWDFPSYQPHITLTYEPGDVDLAKIEPYQGPILLGPEIFQEVKEDWKAELVENRKNDQPREENGQFGETSGGDDSGGDGGGKATVESGIKKAVPGAKSIKATFDDSSETWSVDVDGTQYEMGVGSDDDGFSFTKKGKGKGPKTISFGFNKKKRVAKKRTAKKRVH